MLNNAVENYYQIQVFVVLKTCLVLFLGLKVGKFVAPTAQTDFVFFQIKGLLTKTYYTRFVVYLIAINGQKKNQRNRFFNFCHEIKISLGFFLKVPLNKFINQISRADVLL